MNRDTTHSQTRGPAGGSGPQSDETLQQFKSAWQRQQHTVDDTLTVQPPVVDFASLEARQRRDATPFLILTILCAALAAITLLLRTHTADSELRNAAVALAAICGAAAVVSLMHYASLRWRSATAARFPTFSIAQISSIGFAAIFALAFASHHPVGDGYTLSKNNTTRAEVIGSIDNLFC